MIGSAPAETPEKTTRKGLVVVLAISGITFWCAGAAALWAGHAYSGIALRGLALLLVAILLLRKSTLLAWTFFFMLAGVEVGLDFPRIAAQSQLPGNLFLRLIQMAVAPLILTSIPAGIAAHDHLRSVGRVALKAIIFLKSLPPPASSSDRSPSPSREPDGASHCMFSPRPARWPPSLLTLDGSKRS